MNSTSMLKGLQSHVAKGKDTRRGGTEAQWDRSTTRVNDDDNGMSEHL